MRSLPRILALALLASCGLPVNENPEFLHPDEAELEPDELVIGVALDGIARAYPIKAMAPLEILNDQIGEVPIAVSWCPLSASAAVFDRRIGGTVRTFRFHPDLFRFNLIIEDLETGTRWSQLAMEAIGGDDEGERMRLLPALQTTWEQWYQLYPGTVVMRPEWGEYEFEYRDPGEPGPDGLGPKSLVHVVWLNGGAKAYVLEETPESGKAMVDEIAGRPVVLSVHDGPTALAETPEDSRVAGITMYREYLDSFYPGITLWRGRSAAETSSAEARR